MATKPLGDWGERVAARYLERHGWTVLVRNFRIGRKEIDLVARRGEVVAFVEVKTRASAAFGHALEAIGPRKRREIAHVAAGWIQRFDDGTTVYRFDAIGVTRASSGEALVSYVEDAWRE